MYGHVHVLCYISASMKTRANVFLFVIFSIISFVFVFKGFDFFLFCFSKESNIKDRLDFYHLSHKLNCLFD